MTFRGSSLGLVKSIYQVGDSRFTVNQNDYTLKNYEIFLLFRG